jgi:hypothetical protein
MYHTWDPKLIGQLETRYPIDNLAIISRSVPGLSPCPIARPPPPLEHVIATSTGQQASTHVCQA